MKLNVAVGNVVFDLDAGSAGVVVVKLPRGDRPVISRATLDIDDARGPEIRPGEFLFAGPDKLDGLSGRARQTRRFDRALAGVLAPVTGASVWNDHANFVFPKM